MTQQQNLYKNRIACIGANEITMSAGALNRLVVCQFHLTNLGHRLLTKEGAQNF